MPFKRCQTIAVHQQRLSLLCNLRPASSWQPVEEEAELKATHESLDDCTDDAGGKTRVCLNCPYDNKYVGKVSSERSCLSRSSQTFLGWAVLSHRHALEHLSPFGLECWAGMKTALIAQLKERPQTSIYGKPIYSLSATLAAVLIFACDSLDRYVS